MELKGSASITPTGPVRERAPYIQIISRQFVPWPVMTLAAPPEHRSPAKTWNRPGFVGDYFFCTASAATEGRGARRCCCALDESVIWEARFGAGVLGVWPEPHSPFLRGLVEVWRSDPGGLAGAALERRRRNKVFRQCSRAVDTDRWEASPGGTQSEGREMSANRP
jgi:hypothetical protein